MAGRWFSSGTPVSSTNKTDRHDITVNNQTKNKLEHRNIKEFIFSMKTSLRYYDQYILQHPY